MSTAGRRITAALGAAQLVAALTLLGAAAPAAAAPPASGARAATTCLPATYWADTGDPSELVHLNADGTVLSTVPVIRVLGDIAVSADDGTIYGTPIDGSGTVLTIDPTNGTVTRAFTVTGPGASAGYNSLTALPDGSLLAGNAIGDQLWVVDPTTGASSASPYLLPAGELLQGDIDILNDGDVIALVAVSGDDTIGHLLRLHPDGTSTTVGTVPAGFGVARIGDAVYLSDAVTGVIRKIAAVPTTSSTDPLPTTDVAELQNGPVYGLAAGADSGACTTTADPAPPSRPELAATGIDAWGAMLTALGLLAAGSGLASIRMRRRSPARP